MSIYARTMELKLVRPAHGLETDETVTVLRLQGEAYVEHGRFRRGDTASSVLLRGFELMVSEVFDAR